MSNFAHVSCDICGGHIYADMDVAVPEYRFCDYCVDPRSLRNIIAAGAERQRQRRRQEKRSPFDTLHEDPFVR